ncbi:MAG: peptidase M61 [Bacteroidetes bacterium]|nr:peptidase M61 [Bacteroidota bacterium]HET6245355.1 peptidase M61 [Bacteroidia bacterium]
MFNFKAYFPKTLSPSLIISMLAVFCLFSLTEIQAQAKYEITANLEKVKKDKVKVIVKTPIVKEDKVSWIMPSVIPGSYSLKDFGRFIENFIAFDEKGKKLKVTKEGNNVFHIEDATRLSRIEYLVNDTWDASNDNYIFQPGGTNIDAGKSFVINHQGFWGYLEGYKMLPYEISILKPDNLFGSTALEIKNISSNMDILFASDYVKLVDNPVMYSIPDTVSFMSGNTRIVVSVFSETGVVRAEKVKEYLVPLATSLTDFFGQMPVDKYYFLMYFPEYVQKKDKKLGITTYGGYGALEHSYSSFYFLPEFNNPERVKSMVLSIASHEFLHILTPLNIHSQEIGDFNFRDPKMSKHLWMYEGVTEYFADLIQVRNKFTTYEEFKTEIKAKINKAATYPDVSFTDMSQNILTDQYKEMYSNVYSKGALLGFLLDIRLQELSNGKQSLKDVMLDLSKKYGPNKSFKDDELIDEIISMTSPEIKHYFDNYVIGNKPLPYAEYFNKIGWRFIESRQDSMKTFGKISFTYDAKKEQFLVMNSNIKENAFGLENGDAILSVNDQALTISNYNELLNPIIETRSLQEITLVYKRGLDTLTSKAIPKSVMVEVKNIIEFIPNPTESQLQLRNSLLGF